MKIQILSDLHLIENGFSREGRWPSMISPAADVLVVAGDISPAMTDTYLNFINFCAEVFDYVIVVLGNHEFYCSNIKTIKTYIAKTLMLYKNVHLLDQGKVKIGHCTFIGATLWSHIPYEATKTISDKLKHGWRILDFDSNKMNTLHLQDKRWLSEEIDKFNRSGKEKLIVVTHFAPSFHQTSDPKFEGKESNNAYASDCDCLISKVDYWIYGHTHYPQDQIYQGCRMISNPKGYNDEKLTYSSYKVIDESNIPNRG